MLKNKILIGFKLSDVILTIMLINVKMPTLVGILTFMSMIKIMLSRAEHGKRLITKGLRLYKAVAAHILKYWNRDRSRKL